MVCEDAEIIIMGLGTLICEAQIFADQLQGEGYKVGVLSLKLFRPFPRDDLVKFASQPNIDKMKGFLPNFLHYLLVFYTLQP